MAGHLAIRRRGGLLGGLSAAVQVLDHSQHWGHLQRAAQTLYQDFPGSSPSDIGQFCELAQVQSTWAAIMVLQIKCNPSATGKAILKSSQHQLACRKALPPWMYCAPIALSRMVL